MLLLIALLAFFVLWLIGQQALAQMFPARPVRALLVFSDGACVKSADEARVGAFTHRRAVA